MTDDNFNMADFLRGLSDMSEEDRRKFVAEGISDAMDETTAAIAPRVWAVLQAEMMKSPNDLARLNAILNSAMYAIHVWLAVCTDPGQDDEFVRASDANLRTALTHAREHRSVVSQTAGSIGRLMLMEDALKGMGGALLANTEVLKRLLDGSKK